MGRSKLSSDGLIESMNESINSNGFWEVYHKFCKKLPDSSVSVLGVFNIIPLVMKRLDGDLASFEIHNAVRDFGLNYPKESEELFFRFVESSTPFHYEFIPDVSEAIAKTKGEYYAWQLIHDRLQNEDLLFYLLGAILRVELKNIEKERNQVFQLLEHLLHRVVESTNTAAQGQAVRIYSQFKEYLTDSEKHIITLSGIEHIDIHSKVFWVVEDLYEEKEASQLIEALWLSLASIDREYEALLNRIGSALFKMVDDNSNIVKSFLRQWIVMKADQEGASMDSFQYFFERIYQKKPIWLMHLLTNWINDDDRVFHRGFKGVLSILYVNRVKDISLSETVIKEASTGDISYIVSKVLGYVWNSDHLRSLLYSILKAREDETSLSIIATAFTEYVMLMYPLTKDYLESKKKDTHKIGQDVIEYIIQQSDEYQNNLSALPPLEELEGSQRIGRSYAKLEKELHDEAFNNPRKGSIDELFRHVEVKGGNSMFHRYPGKLEYSDKSKFGSVSIKYEAPRAEFNNQYGMALARLHWVNQKRK